MRVWLDADNGPHVHILRPIAQELTARGHAVEFTARDRTSTCELLDLYGLEYRRVGGAYAGGMTGKIYGTFGRAWQLYREIRNWRPDVSFGHCSRALPIASKLLGIPTLTMYDYEWVDPRIFNLLCKRILLPEVIGRRRCREAGIKVSTVGFYPGLKEELYLRNTVEDPQIVADLGLRDDKVRVLLRPPATFAHYHVQDSDRLLEVVLDELLGRDDVQLVLLPRTKEQFEIARRKSAAQIIVPGRVYDGPSLIATMDMVISGGGTMTREAAVLGVPSYSYFRGREGNVDAWLRDQGMLVLLTGPEDVHRHLRIAKRTRTANELADKKLVAFIADEIVNAV